MQLLQYFFTALLLAPFVICSGCGTVSPLYIPSSDAPAKSFPPPPTAVIRLPVTVTIPKNAGWGYGLFGLLHDHSSESLPQLIHQASDQGLQISKRIAVWNIEGGKMLWGSTLFWRKSAPQNGTTPQVTPAASGKEDPVTLQVGLPLEWNKDWKLMIPSLTPVVTNPPQALPIQTAETLVKLQTFYTHVQVDELNKVLQGVSNLKPRAEDIWTLMQEPIFLDKGIWLLIRPENISTGVMKADPHDPLKLETVLELWAHPILYFGDDPQVEKKPLPPLAAFEPGRAGFRAISNVAISYKEANRFLRDPKTGLINCVIPGTGGQKLTVKGIRLYGAGGKVIAEVQLTYNPFLINFAGKPAQMTIYFRGTPRYSLKKRLFYMPDLDFDVKTSDFLVQVADWILKSDIRKELRLKARIHVGPKLDFLKSRMGEVLNRRLNPYVSLSTQVKTFTILDSFADKDGLQAQIALDGDSQLNVAW